MRRYIRIIYCILLVVAVLGCSDSTMFSDQEWVPASNAKYLHLSHNNLEFENDKNLTKSINIQSINTPWEILGQASWIHFSQLYGDRDADVEVKATENIDPKSSRTAVCVFSSTDDEFVFAKNLTINQQAAKYKVFLSQNTIDAPAASSSFTVDVNANANWSAIVENDWIHCSTDNDKLKVEMQENTTSINSDRIGKVIVKCGDTSASITVNQEPPSVSAKTDTLRYEAEGGAYHLSVNSDVTWTARTSQAWINVSPSTNSANDNVLYVSVVQNNAIEKRSGNVYVCVGNKEIIKIPVVQDGLFLEVDQEELFIGKEGGTDNVIVNTNTSWSILSKPSFLLSAVSSSGTKGQTKVELTFDKNLGGDRSGKIVVGNSSITGLTKTINVTQEGYQFSASETSINFPATADLQHQISLLTNDQWKTETSTNWLHSTPSSGSGNGVVTVSVDRNGTIKERTGYVYIYPEQSYLARIAVRVLQKGRHITATTDSVSFTSTGGPYDIIVDTGGEKIITSGADWLSSVDISTISMQQYRIKITAPKYYGDSIRKTVLSICLEEQDGDERCEFSIPIIQYPPVQTIGIERYGEEQNWNLGGDTNISITIDKFGPSIDWNFK